VSQKKISQGASNSEAPLLFKPLTDAQRDKLLRKVTLWATLHNEDIEEEIKNKSCVYLKCKNHHLCKQTGATEVWCQSEFVLPSIHPYVCFGWMYPDKLETLDK
jgi:hypothetical protein